MKIKRKLILALFAVFVAFSISFVLSYSRNVAFSQELEEEKEKEPVTRKWAIRCAEYEAGKATRCETYYRINTKKTKKRIVEMVVGFSEKKKRVKGLPVRKVNAVIILPLGVVLKEGVELFLNKKLLFESDFNYCLESGCYSIVALSDDVLDKMKNGESYGYKAFLKFKATNGKYIEVKISMKEFTKIFNKISGVR